MLYPESFLDSAQQCAHDPVTQIKYMYMYTQSSPSLEFISCCGVGHVIQTFAHVIQTKVDMQVIKCTPKHIYDIGHCQQIASCRSDAMKGGRHSHPPIRSFNTYAKECHFVAVSIALPK